jgi:hypothetical protein
MCSQFGTILVIISILFTRFSLVGSISLGLAQYSTHSAHWQGTSFKIGIGSSRCAHYLVLTVALSGFSGAQKFPTNWRCKQPYLPNSLLYFQGQWPSYWMKICCQYCWPEQQVLGDLACGFGLSDILIERIVARAGGLAEERLPKWLRGRPSPGDTVLIQFNQVESLIFSL